MAELLRLKAENLACERGGRLIFSKLNFTLEAGQLMELRGTNSAGKSSLLRLLAGLNTPAAGSAVLENGIADATVAEQSHYIGHSEAQKPALTVRENINFWSGFLGEPNNPEALRIFNLDTLADDQAMLLSSGQKRRLALTRLMIAKRSLWLLDEPSVGLDAASVKILQTVITQQLKDGGMVMAATHVDLGVPASHRLELGGRS